MSMWIVHLEKKAVHIVVDSVASAGTSAGMLLSGFSEPQCYTSKFFVLPHIPCVFTGRGDAYFLNLLAVSINRLPVFDFDEVTDNLAGLVHYTALLSHRHAAAELAPPIEARQEVIVCGYSRRNHRAEVRGYTVRDGEVRIGGAITEGTWLGPDIAESRGRLFKPRIKVPVVDLTALAKKQFAEAINDPDCAGRPTVGGQIVYGCVTADTVSTRIAGFHSNHAHCVEEIRAGENRARFERGMAASAAMGWPDDGMVEAGL